MSMPPRTDKPIGRVVTHPLNMAEEDIVTKILNFVADRQVAEPTRLR